MSNENQKDKSEYPTLSPTKIRPDLYEYMREQCYKRKISWRELVNEMIEYHKFNAET